MPASGSPLSPRNFARLVLLLDGAIYLGIAAWGLSSPASLADTLDWTLEGRTSIQEIRAMYGGMMAAVAVLHFVAATRSRFLRPGLAMAGTLLTGLFSGRVVSFAVDGAPGPLGWLLMASELALIATLALAAWRLLRDDEAGGEGEGASVTPGGADGSVEPVAADEPTSP